MMSFTLSGVAKNVNSITQKQGCSDLHLSSMKELKLIFTELYKHGNIKLDRKFIKFSSLMI
jgi:hypothetical protein